MSKYKEFIHGNAPQESDAEDKSVIGTYFKHLNTYVWIQNNPAARQKMKNHPGVKIYRHSGWVLFWVWLGILMLHACLTN